jgi:mono/diheme cytochrome c family protein
MFPSGHIPERYQGSERTSVIATAIVFLALATASCLWAFSDSSKATEELPAGAMQARATTSCLECHEARIILQQRLTKPAWTKEVDKMVKWGALVDAADRDALIDYLSTNFNPDQPPYDPPRSALEKATVRRK